MGPHRLLYQSSSLRPGVRTSLGAVPRGQKHSSVKGNVKDQNSEKHNKHTHPTKHQNMVEFREIIGIGSEVTNPNRIIPSNTLYSRYQFSLRFSYTYRSGCEWRLTNTYLSCEWGLIFLYLHLCSCGTGSILRKILLRRYLDHWSIIIDPCHSIGLFRLCITVRTDKILRSHCHHESIQCIPIHWRLLGGVIVGWVCSKQRNTHAFFSLFISSLLY